MHMNNPAARPSVRAAVAAAGLVSLDWKLATAVALTAAAISTFNILRIDLSVYHSFNIFFQADPPRVIANMSAPWLHQARNATHPLFTVFGLSAVRGLGALGIAPIDAMRGLVVAAGAATAALMFVALRALALPRVMALAFSAALIVSASYLHWYAFIETFPFGGLSTMMMIAVMACLPARSLGWWVVASAATLAMTTTNWLMGLAACWHGLSRRDFIRVSLLALLLVTAIAMIQKKAIDHAYLFFDPRGLMPELAYTAPAMHSAGERWHPLANVRSALVTTMVAPPPEVVVERTERGLYTIVTNQFVPFGRTSATGIAATIAWLVMLGFGCWSIRISPARRAIGMALLVFILGQTAFHLIYGEIIFLYSADFLPALVALAALGWFTPGRRIVAIAISVFIICAAINNETQFLKAARLSAEVATAKANGEAFGR
jgi:hypothetical protein